MKVKLYFIDSDSVTIQVTEKEYEDLKANLGKHTIIDTKESLINLYYVMYVEVMR